MSGENQEARPHSSGPSSVRAAAVSLADLVVPVTGEIDRATAPALSAAVDAHLDRAAPLGRDVVVDLGGVTFIDLHGLRLLLAATDTARSRGVTLQVTECPPCLLRLLQVTGVGGRLNLL